jgi:NAD(P)H-dependent FMN reductase
VANVNLLSSFDRRELDFTICFSSSVECMPTHADSTDIETPAAPLAVAVIIGSVRTGRLGRVMANWFVTVGEARADVVFDLIDLAEVDLPLAGTTPGGVADSPIADRLDAADAFVVITPEYNHSYPAALKNAIDWHYTQWKFKPVAFVGYGAGSGGVRAVEHLRLVFAELSAATTRNIVLVRAPWERLNPEMAFVPDPGHVGAAQATLDELVWWARALRAARRVDAGP